MQKRMLYCYICVATLDRMTQCNYSKSERIVSTNKHIRHIRFRRHYADAMPYRSVQQQPKIAVLVKAAGSAVAMAMALCMLLRADKKAFAQGPHHGREAGKLWQ